MRKDFLINSVGIAGGQAVVLIATPFLARLYSPREFGVYAAVVAASGVVANIASLRFDAAIPAVPDEDVKPLFHLALVLSFFVSIGAVTAIGFLSANFDAVAEKIAVPLGWVGVVAALLGAANVCQAQFTRSGAFAWSATLKVVQPVVFSTVALSAVVGLNGALATAWFFALLAGVIGCRRCFSGIRLNRSIAVARKAWRYPLLSSPMALLDSVSLALPIFFIVASFGNENAGNYSQVQRLIAAPLILFGLAAGQVFFKYAGDRYRQHLPVEPLLRKTVGSLFALAAALVSVAWVIGEPLMGWILGGGWRTDRYFLLLAMAPVTFRMIVSPVSSLFLVANRIGLLGVWQGAYFLVTFVALGYASKNLTFIQFLSVFAITEFVMYLTYLAFAVMIARDQKIAMAN